MKITHWNQYNRRKIEKYYRKLFLWIFTIYTKKPFIVIRSRFIHFFILFFFIQYNSCEFEWLWIYFFFTQLAMICWHRKKLCHYVNCQNFFFFKYWFFCSNILSRRVLVYLNALSKPPDLFRIINFHVVFSFRISVFLSFIDSLGFSLELSSGFLNFLVHLWHCEKGCSIFLGMASQKIFNYPYSKKREMKRSFRVESYRKW